MHSLKLLLAIVALVMAGLAIHPADAKPGKGWAPPGHAKAWGHRAKVRPMRITIADCIVAGARKARCPAGLADCA